MFGFQFVTGFFLTFHFSSSFPFERVVFLMRERFLGSVIRVCHSNGVSLFFFFMFLHVFRGVFFGRFSLFPVWSLGVLVFLVSVLVGFLGYSLP
ncbi:MAG: cytochrome b [Ignavibacteria bacterium]|nr:MAG: cytochrome b [Ignavibacteria bacterium]